jgi:hypothetical protein
MFLLLDGKSPPPPPAAGKRRCSLGARVGLKATIAFGRFIWFEVVRHIDNRYEGIDQYLRLIAPTLAHVLSCLRRI